MCCWKGEKDRAGRSFNPDFFIKIDLDDYISRLESEGKEDHLEELRNLQDEGMETLIKVVEIKSDEGQLNTAVDSFENQIAGFNIEPLGHAVLEEAELFIKNCGRTYGFKALDVNNSVKNSLAM